MADLLADQDVSKMSVRQLKTYIHTAGLPTNDCVEKAELVARAQQAKERFVANPHLDPRLQGSGDLPSGGFFKTTASFHGYDCILAGSKACDPAQQEPDAPDLLVLLMHGFGASANDFEDLPSQLMFKGSGLEDKKVVFAFPHAKVSCRSISCGFAACGKDGTKRHFELTTDLRRREVRWACRSGGRSM